MLSMGIYKGFVVLLVFLLCIANTDSVLQPCTSYETCGSLYPKEYLLDVYYSGLRRISQKAKSLHCKQKIEYEFMKHFRALAEESIYPFENVLYQSQCPNVSTTHPPLKATSARVIKLAHNDTLQLMPNVTAPLEPEKLSILYIMLVHNHPDFAIRIVNALDEPMHHFVIHVDANADEVQQYLSQAFAHRVNIQLVTQCREVISWGGFSIVNATLTAIKQAWRAGIAFDYLIDISGTTYPLKSNAFIRKSLAASPNALYMETYPTPVRPEGMMWNQFVECDGALHRIARLSQPRGINMHVSSQWFAVPRHYVHWLLHSALARDYIHYAQYIIIADENYFATVFHNSPYCQAEVRRNLLFLLFDKWEHERNTTETGRPRDTRKCLGVGENNCGRSPTTLTMDFKNLLGASRMLFARKFDPDNASSMRLVDFIDNMRNTHGNTSEVTEKWDSNRDDGSVSTMIKVGWEAPAAEQGQQSGETAATLVASSAAVAGVANVATDVTDMAPSDEAAGSSSVSSNSATAVGDAAAMQASMSVVKPAECLAYTPASPGYIRRQPCDPANPRQWFEIGRCTLGYELELRDGECPVFRKVDTVATATTSDLFSSVGEASTEPQSEGGKEDVFCAILARSGDKQLCVDIAGENPAYGTPILGYDCTGRWNQLFKLTENCTIVAEQPGFIGRVRGRGDKTIVSCLDARHASGVVVTNACEHLKVPPVSTPATTGSNGGNTTATVDVTISADGGVSQATNVTQPAQTAEAAGLRWQRFRFLPASGTAYKAYMGGKDAPAAAPGSSEGEDMPQ